MKWLIPIFLLVFNHAKAQALGTLQYSEAADVFEIVDNLSMWQKSSRSEYRSYWEKFHGPLKNYTVLLEDYARLRKKYDKSKTNVLENSLFSDTRGYDFFADAFYSSRSVGQALTKLSKKLKTDEIEFLKKMFKELQGDISKMVRESTHFRQKTKELNAALKKGRSRRILKKAADFFGLGKRAHKGHRWLFVWWPRTESPVIEFKGKNLIFRFHPLEQLGSISLEDAMVVAIQGLSAMQPANQKANLSKLFRAKCAPKGVPATHLLEYPLALAWGKMLFAKARDKKNFSLYRQWGLDPWANVMSKMLFPLVEEASKRKKSLAGGFIDAAGMLCSELVTVSHYLD